MTEPRWGELWYLIPPTDARAKLHAEFANRGQRIAILEKRLEKARETVRRFVAASEKEFGPECWSVPSDEYDAACLALYQWLAAEEAK